MHNTYIYFVYCILSFFILCSFSYIDLDLKTIINKNIKRFDGVYYEVDIQAHKQRKKTFE